MKHKILYFVPEMLQVAVAIADLFNEQSLIEPGGIYLAKTRTSVMIHQAFRIYHDGGLK